MRFLVALPLLLVASSIVVSCSNDGASGLAPADGPFEERCRQHCTYDNAVDGACSAEAEQLCLEKCRVSTLGLAFTCGACLIDEGEAIDGEGDPGGGVSCYGGEVAAIANSSCEGFCVSGNHEGTRPAVEARCQQHCSVDGSETAEAYCTAEDTEACVSECETKTGGLAFSCAVCLIDAGERIRAEGDPGGGGYCYGGDLAELASSECSAFCQ